MVYCLKFNKMSKRKSELEKCSKRSSSASLVTRNTGQDSPTSSRSSANNDIYIDRDQISDLENSSATVSDTQRSTDFTAYDYFTQKNRDGKKIIYSCNICKKVFIKNFENFKKLFYKISFFIRIMLLINIRMLTYVST